MISAKLVAEYLEYRNGHLYWIKAKARRTKVGDQFGCLHHTGYRHGRFNGKLYREHRLIWLLLRGTFPDGDLDHINGIRDDNRIENLRERNDQQNNYNKGSLPGSTSKYKGVSWNKWHKKWAAQFNYKGKVKHIGYFEDEKEAANAYDKYTKDIQKDFARKNL